MTSSLFQNLSFLPHSEEKGGFGESYRYTGDLTKTLAGRPALAIVDPQRAFCEPGEGLKGNASTVAIFDGINKLKTLFNQRSLPVFVLYMDRLEKGSIYNAAGGPYGITVNAADILVPKESNSAFQNSPFFYEPNKIKTEIYEREIDSIIWTGVNFSQCVSSNIVDASKFSSLQNFVAADCVANGIIRAGAHPLGDIKYLQAHNAEFVHSNDVLKALDPHQYAQRAQKYREASKLARWIGPQEVFKIVADNVRLTGQSLKALDLATGTGEVPELIKQENRSITIEGIDYTKEMIEIALSSGFIDKGKVGSLTDETVLNDISAAPRYDFVTCSGFIDQIDMDAVKNLTDAVGASLKSGGHFAFTFEEEGNENPGFKGNVQHNKETLRQIFENQGAHIIEEKHLMPAYHKGKKRDIEVANELWLVEYGAA